MASDGENSKPGSRSVSRSRSREREPAPKSIIPASDADLDPAQERAKRLMRAAKFLGPDDQAAAQAREDARAARAERKAIDADREAAQAATREAKKELKKANKDRRAAELAAFGAAAALRKEKWKAPEPEPEPEWAHPEGVAWSVFKAQKVLEAAGARRGPALATDLDTSTAEEKAKAAARLAKWAPEAAAKAEEDEAEKAKEYEARAKRMNRFGGPDLGDEGPAWTRFAATALGPLKLGAEQLLAADEAREAAERKALPQAFGDLVADYAADAPPAAAPASSKLHLAVLPCDRGAFKKLRSNDLEGHFARHGASYAEWLGDTSANIWFPDAAAASRARDGLTAEIPPPPDALVPAGGDATLGTRWRVLKIAKQRADKWGAAGVGARCLARFAGPGDALAAKPKYANEDPLKKSTYRKQQREQKQEAGRKRKKKMGKGEFLRGMSGGLSAARGGTPLDFDVPAFTPAAATPAAPAAGDAMEE